MKRIIGALSLSVLGVGWAATTSLAQPRLPPPPPNAIPNNAVPNAVEDESAEPDVYTRGALHEAFASPASNDPVRTAVVNREPPQAIEELPPDEKPDGDNVNWIPGYWAFDDELEDYIWISGMWRDVPPDREWIPGYWATVAGGYQWVPGMWAAAQQQEVAYYSQPPATQERGPSSPSPGDNYFYVPGCWEYRNQFVWRPGYWAPRQLEWIWVPARWVWTPYGYCLTAGYWDYALVDRGLCYAPVYFRPHHHHHFRARPYRPVVVLNTWDQFTLHLFVQPRFNCYVFGNYYNSPRDRYVPWFRHHGRHGHDPLFSYYSWRNGPDYGRRLDRWHNHFVADVHDRPPVTLREQTRVSASRGPTTVVKTRIAIDLSHRDRDRDRDVKLPVQLTKVSKEEDVRLRTRVDHFRELQQKRVKMEVADGPKAGERGPKEAGPKKLTLDMPRERDRERDRPEGSKIRLPESPDKLKNVKPDSPTEKQARVPSPRRRPEGAAKVETTEAVPEPPASVGDKGPADRKPRPGADERSERERPTRPERDKPSKDAPGAVPKVEIPKQDGKPAIPQVKPREPKAGDPPKREKPPANDTKKPEPRDRDNDEPRKPADRSDANDRGPREPREQKEPRATVEQRPQKTEPQKPAARPEPRQNVGQRPAPRTPSRDVSPARELSPRSPRTDRDAAKPKEERVQVPRTPEVRRGPAPRPERNDAAKGARNQGGKERKEPRKDEKKDEKKKDS